MDNTSLERIVQDKQTRQFWVKPIGDLSKALNEHATFAYDPIRVDFARQPHSVVVGDTLLVYLVGVSKFLFVTEVMREPREASEAEIEREEWRNRWRWSIDGRNLTTTYGQTWMRYSLKPFDLADQFSRQYQQEPQSLGALQFGNDKVRVSPTFGKYVIQKIIELETVMHFA